MNSSYSNDPLVALWKSAPPPDTQGLLQDLQRLKQMHRRLMLTIFAILCGVWLLLILAEAIGRIATHGLLSVVCILAFAAGTIWQWRARCNHINALTSDTVSLLKFMLARAKGDLFLARCLYAGTPCGALVGAVLTKLLHSHRSAIGAHPTLHPILTGAGVVVLIIMVVAGMMLERSRRFQVKELAEKLRSVEAEL